MRRLVCLFVLFVPSLVFAGVAHAAVAGASSKPVCSHYEGNLPKAVVAKAATPAVPASSAAVAATPAAPAVPVRASGGDLTELRPHDAPRWQSFLPGMFR